MHCCNRALALTLSELSCRIVVKQLLFSCEIMMTGYFVFVVVYIYMYIYIIYLIYIHYVLAWFALHSWQTAMQPASWASCSLSASISPAIEDHSLWSWSFVIRLAVPLRRFPEEALYKCAVTITIVPFRIRRLFVCQIDCGLSYRMAFLHERQISKALFEMQRSSIRMNLAITANPV